MGYLSQKRGLSGRGMLSGKSGILRPGTRSLLSGQRGSGNPPPGGNVLPQSGSVRFRFQFTNIGHLWKDTAGTDPVTTDGDDVLAVTNSGSEGGLVIQDSAADDPQWDATEGTIHFIEASVLTKAISGAMSATAWSVAVLGIKADGPNADTDLIMNMDALTELSVRVAYTGTPGDTYTLFQMDLSNEVLASGTVPTYGTFASCAGSSKASDQRARFSPHNAIITTTGTHAVPTSGENIRLGAFTDIGSNGFHGFCKEIIVWDGVALTTAELADVATYDAAVHGINWTAIA